jgi:type III pantothenate kinase
MSVLCLDCGNTRVKWGLRSGNGEWQLRGTCTYAEMSALTVTADRILASNVAGDKGRRAVAALAERIGHPVEWVRAQARQCGVVNGYAHPEQLGADRWLALLAARHRHRGACLVVNAGTATTIDVLGADGVFRGGLILPGVALMREALAAATADLPAAEGVFCPLPTNTFDAIASGALVATAAAIERQFRLLAAEEEPLCLLSGGNAPALLPRLDIPCRHEPDLVLDGLAVVAG